MTNGAMPFVSIAYYKLIFIYIINELNCHVMHNELGIPYMRIIMARNFWIPKAERMIKTSEKFVTTNNANCVTWKKFNFIFQNFFSRYLVIKMKSRVYNIIFLQLEMQSWTHCAVSEKIRMGNLKKIPVWPLVNRQKCDGIIEQYRRLFRSKKKIKKTHCIQEQVMYGQSESVNNAICCAWCLSK